ncbi:hypothetical protein PGTUg99_030207 [Puccinia graminis f. sp. tritici]|uniref:Uncharacterized protein n=1 Tax=Puccinia graminis f. sp. tritici TaxID=56615 RepID=A0A5B0SKG7_PUCGR|nr:hypothetical protein PGTUg99_030207 [Puccinia graminis f. sp. tritici]
MFSNFSQSTNSQTNLAAYQGFPPPNVQGHSASYQGYAPPNGQPPNGVTRRGHEGYAPTNGVELLFGMNRAGEGKML